jgi:hypothetical protein
MTAPRVFVHADTGRTGLGNMLFSWARAEILARRHGWTMLAPRWVKPKLGPLLRRERDKRYYVGAFRSDGYLDGWRRQVVMWTAPRVSEDDEPAIAALARAPRRALVVTRGMERLFAPLLAHREHLASRFHAMLAERLRRRLDEEAPGAIAVHVRRSDFRDFGPGEMPTGSSSNCRIPDAWYARCIAQARAALPNAPVRIFSDARPSELASLLAIADVESASPAPAALDLARLARAKLLIGSAGSSFSLWGSFLGRVPLVLHPSHDRMRIGGDLPGECITAPDGTIPHAFLDALSTAPTVNG